MKIIRSVLFLLICCFLYQPSVLAQNGAVIVRGDMFTFWAEWDGDLFVAFANSAALGAFCGLETETVEGKWKIIEQPIGEFKKWHDNGDYFTQVYDQISVEEFFVDPCGSWQNEPIIAEGIVHMASNGFGWGPNGNASGYTFSGTLYDLDGNCASGMVDLNIIRRWRWNKKLGDYVSQVNKGPRLTCTN